MKKRIFFAILGLVIVAYALYALLELRPPELSHPAWGFAFGLLAGMLGGAYNTSGPPVVVYGNSRRWLPVEFKSNLQGFFFLNSVLVVSGHALSHNFTQAVVQNYLTALPALALGYFSTAIISRMMRSSMLEVLGRSYITTARAKGLREFTVLTRHAMRNALIPIVTLIGLEFGSLLGGAVITETIFAWPGVGRLSIQAINGRDIPLVQACVIVLAGFFVLINLVVDLIYTVLDPRIRLGQ